MGQSIPPSTTPVTQFGVGQTPDKTGSSIPGGPPLSGDQSFGTPPTSFHHGRSSFAGGGYGRPSAVGAAFGPGRANTRAYPSTSPRFEPSQMTPSKFYDGPPSTFNGTDPTQLPGSDVAGATVGQIDPTQTIDQTDPTRDADQTAVAGANGGATVDPGTEIQVDGTDPTSSAPATDALVSATAAGTLPVTGGGPTTDAATGASGLSAILADLQQLITQITALLQQLTGGTSAANGGPSSSMAGCDMMGGSATQTSSGLLGGVVNPLSSPAQTTVAQTTPAQTASALAGGPTTMAAAATTATAAALPPSTNTSDAGSSALALINSSTSTKAQDDQALQALLNPSLGQVDSLGRTASDPNFNKLTITGA